MHEDAMLLTDIVNTLMTVNALGSKAILNEFRRKLSQFDITPNDVNTSSAKNIERLLNLCQKPMG